MSVEVSDSRLRVLCTWKVFSSLDFASSPVLHSRASLRLHTGNYKMNLQSLYTTVNSITFSSLPKTRPIDEGPYNFHCLGKRVNSDSPSGSKTEFLAQNSLKPTRTCFLCGRRHFLEAAGMATTLFPIRSSKATNSDSEYEVNAFSISSRRIICTQNVFNLRLLMIERDNFCLCRLCLTSFTPPELTGMKSY